MERTFIEAQKERLLALRQEMSEKVEQVQENVAQGLAPSDATDQEEVAVINNMRQIDMAGAISLLIESMRSTRRSNA